MGSMFLAWPIFMHRLMTPSFMLLISLEGKPWFGLLDIAQREKRACESSESGYEAIMARLDEADKAHKILEDEVADLKRQSSGLGNASQIDTPMLASELNRLGALSHFTVIRKLEGGIFPMGFTKEVTDRNLKAGLNILGVESSERALLNRLMLELHKLDSDVLVGHNISGFDLDILLHRAQVCFEH